MEKKWRFTGIYCCPERKNKKVTCELIRRLAETVDSPWLIGGDLNECLWEKEKKGGTHGDFRNMELFRDLLSDLQLQDLGFEGSTFTWTNKGRNRPVIMKRLDRFLGNEFFCNLFCSLKVIHLDWYF